MERLSVTAFPTIALENVAVVRDGRRVLDIAGLMLTERRIGVVGINGSGKSTLLKLIDGLVLPSEGHVTVDGLSTATDGAAIRRRVGFVFQNPDNQVVFPIVADDLAFGLKNSGLAKAEIPARAQAALDRLGIGHLAKRRIHELSGGEKQLVALAGVIAVEPATILFDEPTTLLDLRNRDRFVAVLAGLPQQTIIASHDLDLIATCERVIVIHEARVAIDAPAAAAIAAYRELAR